MRRLWPLPLAQEGPAYGPELPSDTDRWKHKTMFTGMPSLGLFWLGGFTGFSKLAAQFRQTVAAWHSQCANGKPSARAWLESFRVQNTWALVQPLTDWTYRLEARAGNLTCFVIGCCKHFFSFDQDLPNAIKINAVIFILMISSMIPCVSSSMLASSSTSSPSSSLLSSAPLFIPLIYFAGNARISKIVCKKTMV